jgi:hypothetical protein
MRDEHKLDGTVVEILRLNLAECYFKAMQSEL